MAKTLVARLEAVERAALGNDRDTVLASQECPELLQYLNYALSPDITFGLKQVPKAIPAQIAILDAAEWWTELASILDELADRKLTGNAAKKRVGSFLGLCTENEAKWAERVITQDLRLGFGASTVNRIWPDTISQFKIPLAKPFKDLKSLKGSWARQPKMDGGRFVARLKKNGGSVKLLSRTGKEWGQAFDPIKLSVEKLSKKLDLSYDATIDGEVVIFKNGRMDFQAMQRLFHVDDDRKPEGDMVYVLFDFCTTKEYDNPTLTYGERFQSLQDVVGRKIGDLRSNLRIIDSCVVVDPDKESLDKAANDFVIQLGCDGAIIRRTDVVPKNSKTSDITKVKPFEDAEAYIRGKIEGKGHLVGSLGTMECELIDKKGKATGIIFEIGTGEGLTKGVRQELWDDRDLTKKIVNFKYLRLSEDGVPQLPTYRAIRHPDDIG